MNCRRHLAIEHFPLPPLLGPPLLRQPSSGCSKKAIRDLRIRCAIDLRKAGRRASRVAKRDDDANARYSRPLNKPASRQEHAPGQPAVGDNSAAGGASAGDAVPSGRPSSGTARRVSSEANSSAAERAAGAAQSLTSQRSEAVREEAAEKAVAAADDGTAAESGAAGQPAAAATEQQAGAAQQQASAAALHQEKAERRAAGGGAETQNFKSQSPKAEGLATQPSLAAQQEAGSCGPGHQIGNIVDGIGDGTGELASHVVRALQHPCTCWS